MNPESPVKENRSPKDPDEALNEIKDRAVMLSIASEYLCEDPFLKKMGLSIAQNIEVLENHIQHVKRQFVGKLVVEINLNEHLERIAHIAKLLQEVDDGVKHKCVEGEVGKELGEKVISLASGINALKDKVEGKPVSYTRTDSVLGVFEKLRFLVYSLTATYRFSVKIFGVVILGCLMAFSFLFITLETEEGLLEKIDHIRAQIGSGQAACSRLNEKLKQVQEKIENIREEELSRQDGINLMALNLKAYKLSEEREKTKIEVEIHERALEKNLKKLEGMRKKSFLERLLRQ